MTASHYRDLQVRFAVALRYQIGAWHDMRARLRLTWRMTMGLTRFHNPAMRTLDGLRMILNNRSELYR